MFPIILDDMFRSTVAALRRRRAIGLPIAALAVIGWAMTAWASPPPVLHLDFEHGLTPAIGPKQPGEWSGKTPPQFDEQGLTGKGLLVTEASPGKITFPAPAGTRSQGTLVLWSRGLENWDIWGRGNNRHLWPGATLIETHGPEGGLLIYKWSWYESIACLLMPGGGQGNASLGEWPNFDQYQWTQIGISWQGADQGVKRLRLYLNGEAVRETGGQFPCDVFALSADVSQGSRRMYDDLKIWDRALPASEIKRLFRRDGQIVNQPVVSVPRLAAAPTIDGTIGPSEWDGATRITGLLDASTGEAAEHQSVMYLGYDAEYLYVAMTGDMTPYARDNPALVNEKFLRAEGRGRAANLDADDAVEMLFAPGYWQVADHRTPGAWKEYGLLANAAGACNACAYGPGGANAAWNPDCQMASHAGRDGWQFEARIWLAAFGGPAPRAGRALGAATGPRVATTQEPTRRLGLGPPRAAPCRTRHACIPARWAAPAVPFQPDPTCALYSQPKSDSPLGSLGMIAVRRRRRAAGAGRSARRAGPPRDRLPRDRSQPGVQGTNRSGETRHRHRAIAGRADRHAARPRPGRNRQTLHDRRLHDRAALVRSSGFGPRDDPSYVGAAVHRATVRDARHFVSRLRTVPGRTRPGHALRHSAGCLARRSANARCRRQDDLRTDRPAAVFLPDAVDRFERRYRPRHVYPLGRGSLGRQGAGPAGTGLHEVRQGPLVGQPLRLRRHRPGLGPLPLDRHEGRERKPSTSGPEATGSARGCCPSRSRRSARRSCGRPFAWS